jgi:hypothetical protein
MQNMAEGGPIYKGNPLPAVRRVANLTGKDENFQALTFAARSSALSCYLKWTMGWARAQGMKEF